MVQATKNIGGMSELVEIFLMHMCIQSDPGEPTNWKEALNGPEREWWLKSVTSDLIILFVVEIGNLFHLSQVGTRKLVPTKLVFKKKDEIDGSIRYKTRNVTLGFMMVPGVDFTERFSPVATDE